MRPFLLLSLALVTPACTTMGGKKTTSSWYALSKADDVECASWPLQPRDLRVNELMLMDGAKHGFLANVMKRDGSPGYYYAAFDDGVKVDRDELKEIKPGRGALVIGGGHLGAIAYAAVVQNSAQGAQLELRSVTNNVVKAKGELGKTRVQEATMWASGSGIWVAYDAEAGGQLAHLDVKGEKITAKTLAPVNYASRPVVMPGAGGTALVVTRQGEAGQPLKARVVTADGRAEVERDVPLKVDQALESWGVAPYMGAYVAAVVDGDSLVGQANLRVTQFSWRDEGPAASWSRDVILKDVHVTEPVFLKTKAGLQILLLNWVDEESTIARYMVAGGTISKPKYSGIFPKGTRIVSAFTGPDDDDAYVIVRHRDDTRWSFRICKI